jgi:hypothetical protein
MPVLPFEPDEDSRFLGRLVATLFGNPREAYGPRRNVRSDESVIMRPLEGRRPGHKDAVARSGRQPEPGTCEGDREGLEVIFGWFR